ncbi:hypothetical protein AAY80_093 [Stenotrophomonas phage vB_SmaS-DLP_6]|nr:hypothetical protein AAY80_093 [Stenotrophomonas phage vB_SmaS-DLP_6]
MFKHWFKYVGVPAIKGIVYGFILAHVLLLPLILIFGFPYLPLSILVGNLVGTFVVGIFLTRDFLKNTYPRIKAREAGLTTKEF